MMYICILLLLWSSYVKAQSNECVCFCCVGQSCTLTLVGSSSVPLCTNDTCSVYCRNTYYACRTELTNGYALPLCQNSISVTTISPLFNCRCDCCYTGSISCQTSLVGYGTVYLCQTSSCSIMCASQYPSRCVSNQYGQTIGTCISNITAATTTTTISTIIGFGYPCSCRCCQSGPSCSPDIEVGSTMATYCSTTACTSACQNRYPALCPSVTYLGHTNGICINENTGNTRCRCQCCETSICSTFIVYTNNDCSSCTTLCQQRCGNARNVTSICESNQSIGSTLYSPSLFIFIFISLSYLFFD